MCNPRRVMIHVNRSIEEAWQRTVEEVATASAEVNELARLTADVALDAEMGDAALAMLSRVLAGEFEGYEAWARDDQGRFWRELEEVLLRYNPATRQLTIEAQLTAQVSAEARGAAEASGFTVGDVAVEAVGNYYSDGWGGRTRERAEAEAQAQAEQRLAAAIEALHREQNVSQLDNARLEARERAEAELQARLSARQAEVRAALRERLQYRLANAQERAQRLLNRAVGEAYRQTLHQLVRENGGRILVDETTGAVINMELELY